MKMGPPPPSPTRLDMYSPSSNFLGPPPPPSQDWTCTPHLQFFFWGARPLSRLDMYPHLHFFFFWGGRPLLQKFEPPIFIFFLGGGPPSRNLKMGGSCPILKFERGPPPSRNLKMGGSCPILKFERGPPSRIRKWEVHVPC